MIAEHWPSNDVTANRDNLEWAERVHIPRIANQRGCRQMLIILYSCLVDMVCMWHHLIWEKNSSLDCCQVWMKAYWFWQGRGNKDGTVVTWVYSGAAWDGNKFVLLWVGGTSQLMRVVRAPGCCIGKSIGGLEVRLSELSCGSGFLSSSHAHIHVTWTR
jgi:hypothetical protein